jgi:hypothetical protein
VPVLFITIAVALWLWHLVDLLRGWGRFRPQIALAHGLLAAALLAAGGRALASYSGLYLFLCGLMGIIAVRGHRLAPGVAVGTGLLLPLVIGAPALGGDWLPLGLCLIELCAVVGARSSRCPVGGNR